LPDASLKGLKVVNFSGQRLVSVNSGGWASHIADGDPHTELGDVEVIGKPRVG
jgi:hypothetical protein